MSIPINVHQLTESEITLCENDLIITEEKKRNKSFYAGPVKTNGAYRKEKNQLMVPFHWGAIHFGNEKRATLENCDSLQQLSFCGMLRPEQMEIQKESLSVMKKQGACLIAVYPGGGKTITSLSIASVLGLKTFILVNKLVLIKQWLETIQWAFGGQARVQVLYPKTKMDPTCHFYIMNAINVCKKSFEEYSVLKVGLVIVDECHLMMTKIFSQSLTYFCPRYLIGLSATPFRPDGFDAFLDLYFGKEKVVRKLFRPHKVLLLESGITIQSQSDARGELIWNSVIEYQTNHEDRNKMIADLCIRFKTRNILVLSKRIKQIETLHQHLESEGEHVTMIKEGEVTFDLEARIVIATFQKVGTGFSHNKLDMLILATDAEEYFMQYLGRVFRTPDVVPVVIDIVDKHPVLKKHFKSRKKIYEEAGGEIENYNPKVVDLTPHFDRKPKVQRLLSFPLEKKS